MRLEARPMFPALEIAQLLAPIPNRARSLPYREVRGPSIRVEILVKASQNHRLERANQNRELFARELKPHNTDSLQCTGTGAEISVPGFRYTAVELYLQVSHYILTQLTLRRSNPRQNRRIGGEYVIFNTNKNSTAYNPCRAPVML